MIAAPVESWGWSKRRWLLMLAFVMAVQLGLIFWLSGPDVVPRPSTRTQSISMVAGRTGLAGGLSDPTLFVLPNRHGFSGPAWLNTEPLAAPPLEWTEPPQWLTQEVARLGRDFCAFVSTNVTATFELERVSGPDIIPPMGDLVTGLAPTQSTIRIEGELADRSLVSPLPLTSQTAPDTMPVLKSSEVTIGVKPDGTVFSAKLAKGCGSKGVDNEAVRLALAARFKPLPPRLVRGTPATLSWGTLIMQWYTSAPATNTNSLGAER